MNEIPEIPLTGVTPAWRHQVRTSDCAVVREVATATAFFSPAEVDVAVSLVEERLSKGEASGYQFIFAEVDERPVGYCCFGEIACTVGSYDLYWIVVAPRVQGCGLGRALLTEAEQCMRSAGCRRVYIETSGRPQYEHTRAFYQRCGYRCEAVLPDFYALTDDKLIYVKELF